MNILRASTGMLAILLLAGCGAAGTARDPGAGRVTGRLLMEGGPLGPNGQQPGERPIDGTVTFTAAGHRAFSVRAGKSGTFSAQLPAGRYRVSGKSPLVVEVSGSARRELPCSQPLTLTVAAGHTATIAVTCTVP